MEHNKLCAINTFFPQVAGHTYYGCDKSSFGKGGKTRVDYIATEISAVGKRGRVRRQLHMKKKLESGRMETIVDRIPLMYAFRMESLTGSKSKVGESRIDRNAMCRSIRNEDSKLSECEEEVSRQLKHEEGEVDHVTKWDELEEVVRNCASQVWGSKEARKGEQ
jgi:hypothetical protein